MTNDGPALLPFGASARPRVQCQSPVAVNRGISPQVPESPLSSWKGRKCNSIFPVAEVQPARSRGHIRPGPSPIHKADNDFRTFYSLRPPGPRAGRPAAHSARQAGWLLQNFSCGPILCFREHFLNPYAIDGNVPDRKHSCSRVSRFPFLSTQ